MIGLRVGSDGVSAGLPDAGGEIVTVRVWCAVPVHDELIAKSWMRIDGLVSARDKESIDLLHRSERPLREPSDQLRTILGKRKEGFV